MNINFEHDFQKKIMVQVFEKGILSDDDLNPWRSQWTAELSKWHSPYKVLIDLRHVAGPADVGPSFQKKLQVMLKFFKGFHCKSVWVLCEKDSVWEQVFADEKIFHDEDLAYEKIGLNRQLVSRTDDFRAAIIVENHYRDGIMEVSFSHPVVFDSEEKLTQFKQKLQNNLMTWHSTWNLLLDGSQAEFLDQMDPKWKILEKFLRGFFMKDWRAYNWSKAKGYIPMPYKRTRHLATIELGGEGLVEGDKADCVSRK